MVKQVGKWAYAILMGILLLSYLYIMATYKEGTLGGGIYSLPVWIWALRLASVALALWLGKLWKDRGFLILMLYLLLMTVRLLLEESRRLFSLVASENLLCGLWVYAACYGMARVFPLKEIKRILSAVAAVWTAGMVFYSGLGIYAVWTDQLIPNLTKTAYIGTVYGRLWIFYYANPTAAVVSLSLIVAMLMAVGTKNRWVRMAYSAAFVVLFVTLALTATRTAHVTAGVGIGGLAGIGLWSWMKKKNVRPLLAVLPAVMVGLVLMVGVAFGLMQLIPVINGLRQRGGLISVAMAEEAAKGIAVHSRSFTADLTLNGRTGGWIATLKYLRDNPLVLLTGASIFNPMEGVQIRLQHTHCRPLMVLLEAGIPGLALYLAFYTVILVRSIRVIRNTDAPRWIRILPVLPLSILAGELVECLTWQQTGIYPMLPFLFVAMGIISAAGQKDSVIQ